MSLRLNSKQIRNLAEEQALQIKQQRQTFPIYFILDSVYDTYNTGSFFRLAEALGIKKIYLTGQMETPPNIKIKRAAVGTDKLIDWEYKKDIKKLITDLKKNNFQIIAIEQTKDSTDYREISYKFPLALVLGNETKGVNQAVLNYCDYIAEIPMYGVNKSLNVLVSASVVGYWILKDQPKRFLLQSNAK
ncbi:MAG: hypothetical protein KatS3mg090_0763 [Patescibacteria group bacterium]|nr:MAG: hypothetical protein KatS3mg090_0763 [Patescibacteria group bacterium]